MRTQTLVCTANCPDGWNFSTTDNHYEKTIELHIYRFRDGGKMEKHPAYGKKWKYGKAKNISLACEKIREVCDKIGLAVGALVVYNR